MRNIARYALGHFNARELRGYLLCLAGAFWGLIFFCWRVFPPQNAFGFGTHSFSYLGGFDACNNPRWWWVFSVAMTLWGAGLLPVLLYIYRRFRCVSPWGARIGLLKLLLGAAGIVLVGVIPTGHGVFIGRTDWGLAHRYAGLLVLAAFGFGIFWHEILLFVDRFSRRRLAPRGYGRFVALYAAWWALAFSAVYFLGRWMLLYPRLQKEAAAHGKVLLGAWTEALNTRYSTPLWENVMIFALYGFLTCFPLLLPATISAANAAPPNSIS